LCLSAGSLQAKAAQDAPPAQAPALPAAPTAALPAKGAAKSQRNASKRFLAAAKLFQEERYEEAMQGFQQAAKLDPANRGYPLAVETARNHAVTALIQSAAKERARDHAEAALAALAHARELNPNSPQVAAHLGELGGDALAGSVRPLYTAQAENLGAAVELQHTAGKHSFHLHVGARDAIQQVFKAWGVIATFDESVRPNAVRFDMDDATFDEAAHTLMLLTGSFYVVLDPHRVLFARNSHENRLNFERQILETIYFSGLSKEELADLGKMAKDLFNIQNSNVDNGENSITLRAPPSALDAFNVTARSLLEGHNQLMLDVRVIQVAHTSERNSGVQLPQTMTGYNLYTEEQSILNANQALVQQIISSGLAPANNPLAILGVLIASGQVSSSLFGNGLALFGGGLTLSALAPGSDAVNLSLNSSDTRALDQVQLRLGDGEEGRVRLGERYPIVQSSYSSTLGAAATKIAGLTSAGTSGTLSSLLSSYGYGSGYPTVPMVNYEDIGLTLKATPRIMRSGDVALTLDLKIDALGGSSIGDNPILDNRSYSGVVTLKEGEGVVIAQELDKKQARTLSGAPGITEIPGLNNLTDTDKQSSYATLLVVMTPHLLRSTQKAGHTPMMRVEPLQQGR
jgi:tetratricopeptide (TPR) repeat protein